MDYSKYLQKCYALLGDYDRTSLPVINRRLLYFNHIATYSCLICGIKGVNLSKLILLF